MQPEVIRVTPISALLLWTRWVWMSALGSTLGWFLYFVVGFLALLVGIMVASGNYIVGLIVGWIVFLAAGGIIGLPIGWAQGRVLRRAGPARIESVRWETCTAWGGAAAVLTFLLMFFGTPVVSQIYRSLEAVTVMGLLSTLAGAAVLGAFQWRTLRRYVQGAAWWIPANLVAWGVGWYTADRAFGPLIASIPGPDGTLATGIVFFFYVELNLATIIANAVTGLAMLWLLQQPRSEAWASQLADLENAVHE